MHSLFHNINHLKNTKRQGWTRYPIANVESVADHSYGLAFMAMIIGDRKDLDTEKMMKMALIHDLAEASIGDITPNDGISKERKLKMESKAIKEIFADYPKYVKLWEEFCKGSSKEAKELQRLDKLEMQLQAREYEEEYDIDLSEFYE